MKRIMLLLIIVLFVWPNIKANYPNHDYPYSKSDFSDVNRTFKNSFYLTFARTYALNDFETNWYMSKGLGINIGHIFYLHSINFSEKIHFGFDATFFSWAFCISKDNFENDISVNSTHFLSAKIGPIASFNPVGQLIIDTRFTFQPTYVTYDYIASGHGYKFRKGLGIFMRYRPWTLGLDYSWGKTVLHLKDMGNYNKEFQEISTDRIDIVFGFAF